jgi:hypothetical protein
MSDGTIVAGVIGFVSGIIATLLFFQFAFEVAKDMKGNE